MTSKNNRAPLLYYINLCASFQTYWWIRTAVTIQKRSIRRFSVLCDLEIWWMTLENNRAPLLCYFKLCKSFKSHRWIQTGVTVRKRSIPLKISDIVTLKFHRWPWKTTGHLFYATSRFEHHFIAICEFKLELQSENSNLDFDIFFWQCDLEIWRITLKNNNAPLLCYFSLYASFHSHLWIQTGDTVQKRPIWVKINDFFLAMWPWNLRDDLENQ